MFHDIIGDIHGHAQALRTLLTQLGYRQQDGRWSGPEGRQVLFLGDYIDRGPCIVETVEIVRSLCDQGLAIALMGNHEFNAVAWNVADGNGDWCRSHNDSHRRQHSATLEQFGEDSAAYRDLIAWCRTLPFQVEIDGIRAVHACWHPDHMAKIAKALHGAQGMDDAFVRRASPEGDLHEAVEIVLKGIEATLPGNATFTDKDNHKRTQVRVQWWRQPEAGESLRQWVLSVPVGCALPDLPASDLAAGIVDPLPLHAADAPPCFVGHYQTTCREDAHWPNLTCLDHSICKKDGRLTAYRWCGETELDDEHFVSVAAITHPRLP